MLFLLKCHRVGLTLICFCRCNSISCFCTNIEVHLGLRGTGSLRGGIIRSPIPYLDTAAAHRNLQCSLLRFRRFWDTTLQKLGYRWSVHNRLH